MDVTVSKLWSLPRKEKSSNGKLKNTVILFSSFSNQKLFFVESEEDVSHLFENIGIDRFQNSTLEFFSLSNSVWLQITEKEMLIVNVTSGILLDKYSIPQQQQQQQLSIISCSISIDKSFLLIGLQSSLIAFKILRKEKQQQEEGQQEEEEEEEESFKLEKIEVIEMREQISFISLVSNRLFVVGTWAKNLHFLEYDSKDKVMILKKTFNLLDHESSIPHSFVALKSNHRNNENNNKNNDTNFVSFLVGMRNGKICLLIENSKTSNLNLDSLQFKEMIQIGRYNVLKKKKKKKT